MKLAAQIIKPSAGEVKILGLGSVAAVSPELKIYDDLTAAENLKFFAALRGAAVDLAEMSGRVDLDFENEIRAGDFSTGMKQRLKFAILLSVAADIWLLDEPTANLDASGREIFYREIRASAAEKLILPATNDAADLEVCDEIIKLPL